MPSVLTKGGCQNSLFEKLTPAHITGVSYYMGAFETPSFLYVLLHILYEIIFYFFQFQSVHINHLKLLYGDIKIV